MFIIEDWPNTTMYFDLSKPDKLHRIYSKDDFISANTMEMIDKKTLFVVTDFDGIDLSGHGSVNLLYICGVVDGMSHSQNKLRIEWRVTNPYWKYGTYLTNDTIHQYRLSPSGTGYVDPYTNTILNYNLIGFVLLHKNIS